MCLLARIKTIVCRFFTLIEFCHRCGARQPIVWDCESNELWLKVVGYENGVVCPRCFDELAMEKDIYPRWTVRIGD